VSECQYASLPGGHLETIIPMFRL